MYYKISEVSQMIGIPVDTIRYYEKMGIVSPIRKGTYRAFSDEDVYLLCEYKKMRSYGLTLKEIKEFSHLTSMKNYVEQFESIRDYYNQKVKYYQALNKSIEKSVDMLRNVENYVGKYQIMDFQATYYIDFYQQKEFDPEKLAIWKSWVYDYYPLVEYLAVWDLDDGESENITQNSMWVNAISEENVIDLNIPVNDMVQKIPSQKALFTVVNRYGEKLVDQAFTEEIRRELRLRNLQLAGKIVGKMMARIEEGDRMLRYIGVWIPVYEQDPC